MKEGLHLFIVFAICWFGGALTINSGMHLTVGSKCCHLLVWGCIVHKPRDALDGLFKVFVCWFGGCIVHKLRDAPVGLFSLDG